jgi:hypothetical protein
MRRPMPTTDVRFAAGFALLLGLLLAVPLAAVATTGGSVNPFAAPHAASTHALPVELRLTHPTAMPHLNPRTQAVDPTAFYTGEPAPMGIADFGVDSSGNGYSYTTNEFLGIVSIDSISVYNAANTGYESQLTFQENIVFDFTVGGTEYQYWIQDVVFLDTSDNQTSFENNIWNMTSSTMDSGTVTGNGSVYGGQFYAETANTPGSGATLVYPTAIELLVVESVVNNKPSVAFEYRDGGAWETYDNVVFPFGLGATNVAFSVDGTQYDPIGLFNDAELILGGPGGGSEAIAQEMNVTLQLQYYNGHNFQAIRNAYNFGSDTGETITNVTSTRASSPDNASLGVHVGIGNSALALAYGSAYASVVQINAPVSGGSLAVGSSPLVAFSGSSFNVTLAPGTFEFDVYNATGAIAGVSATVPTGGSATVTIPAGTAYPLQFTETGLTTNHSWSIQVGSLALATQTPSITFYMVDGNYSYDVPIIPGFHLNGSRGTLQIAGAPTDILLTFVQVVYPVTLYETGLPSGTSWSVTVNNVTYSTTEISQVFHLGNGTYPYHLTIIPGWTASPHAQGRFVLTAAPVQETLQFHEFTYPILSKETGLPSGTGWGIRIGGNWTNGTIYALRSTAPNGSFSFRVDAPSGWAALPATGTLNVTGANASLNVSFSAFQFEAVFTEQGLSAGTPWGVVVGSVRLNSTNASLTALLANGSYGYTVDSVNGYQAPSPSAGTLQVDAGVAPTTIRYAAIVVPDGFLIGSIQPAGATVRINGTILGFSGISFNLSLTPGPHSMEVTLSGYHPYFQNYSIESGARTLTGTIVLVPITQPPPGTTGGGGGGAGSGTPAGLSGEELGLAVVALGAVAVVVVALWMRGRRT